MPQDSETLKAARAWAKAGFNVIPIKANGKKAPALETWKPYQSRLSTPAELERWFGDGTTHGIAVVWGAISGNGEVLDFDEPGLFEQFAEACRDHGAGELVDSLPLIETPSGGRHLLYRCEVPPAGNQKLAQRLDANGRPETLIETRGEGGYTIAPGSPPACHPDNRQYVFLGNGRPHTVPIISADDRSLLLAMAALFNEYVDQKFVRDAPRPKRETIGGGKRPGDDYNERGDYECLLERHGWQHLRQTGGKGSWRRPGKQDGLSATSNYGGAGLFYVFSSNAAPFEPNAAYSPFAVYAFLEHGGDYVEAARALGKSGYGEQSRSPAKLAEDADRAARSARGPRAKPAGDTGARAEEAAQSGTETQPEDAPIPEPAGHTDKGFPDFTAYQIAQILGLETRAADTDAALALRMVRVFKDEMRFCKELGWLVWDGRRWLRDDTKNSRAAARVVTLSRVIQEEAALLFTHAGKLVRAGRTADGEALGRAARSHLKHIKLVESEPFAQRAMILARPGLSVEAIVFEPKPWLIGFENGVWDRGKWRAHRREDFLMDLCPVQIDTTQKGPGQEWPAVLERITGGDADYALSLQDVAGYALSGASHLRLLPWAYGPKGTGKSTFSELLMTTLGNTAASLDSKLLSSDGRRDRLGAVIWGKRLVVCAEAGNQRIDSDLLKTLSGGDSYPVAFHYQEAFTARPTHALLMTANDPPSMNAYDDALRDRIITLPCHHPLSQPTPLVFSSGSRIEAVRSDVEAPLVREFAAWALAGLARVFRSQQVHQSARITNATGQFWRDMDPLKDFWETIEPTQLKAGMTRADLRHLYLEWCVSQGVRRPIGPQVFTQACVAAGLIEYRRGNDRGWRLLGDWQFAYGMYTLDPISHKTSHEENKSYKGFMENSPQNVHSVRNDGEDLPPPPRVDGETQPAPRVLSWGNTPREKEPNDPFAAGNENDTFLVSPDTKP